jgi:hypothetical protein
LVREVRLSNPSMFRVPAILVVCLGFTGPHVAWAGDAQFTPQDEPPADIGDRTGEGGPPRPDLYVEDPYAPHHTSGSEARFGTIVGFVYGQPKPVLALGVVAAAGYRFGRLALESEVQAFTLQSHGTIMTAIGPADGDFGVGHGERLGALARLDVIRLGPHVVGPNSLLSIYVEGGAAVAWTSWSKPEFNQPSRIVPDDTKRVEGQLGFGLALDHRLQEPIGFPHRIAWFLGWRLAFAPHEAMTATVCRGVSCRPITMEDDASYVDRSMLFQSSLAFTF